MKGNTETSMEPRLQQEIQMLLSLITASYGKSMDASHAASKLSGICTAIHVFTGEVWIPRWNDKKQYILVLENGSECITPNEALKST